MNIREIRIHRYGPLSNLSLENLQPFTLIYGKNESGKTLFLDAILRCLLNRKRDQELFSHLDRVDRDPEGFIDIQRGSTLCRFPEDGSLSDELNIHPEDLRNVLVVHASDLQLPEEEEANYYSTLTDRLMGIHRDALQSIRSALQDLGKLTNETSSARLSNREDYGKIRERYEKAQEILEDIEEIQEKTEGERPEELETQLVRAQEDLAAAQHKRQLLEDAQRREEYHNSSHDLKEIRNAFQELRELPEVTSSQQENWREAKRILAQTKEELAKEREKRIAAEEDLSVQKEIHQTHKENLTSIKHKSEVVDDFKKKVERQDRRFRSRDFLKNIKPFSLYGFLIFTILLGLSIIGLILRPAQLIFTIFVVVFGLGFLGFGFLLLLILLQNARTTSGWRNLKKTAETYHFKGDTFTELHQSAEHLSEELETLQMKCDESQTELGRAEARLENSQERIQEFEEKQKDSEHMIQQLQEETGVASLEELQNTLSRREELEKKRDRILTRLEERYNTEDLPLEERMEAWEENIQDLADYKNAAPDVDFDSDQAKVLQKKINHLEQNTAQLAEDLEGYHNRFADIAKNATSVLRETTPLPGDTMQDVEKIARQLKTFRKGIEIRMEDALIALEIFEEIEKKEEEKVRELFGEADHASHYFQKFTNGTYQAVEYDPGDKHLWVTRKDGERFRATQLSTGTYDQLYFATRLSLAHRLLEGEPGFLFLDDPFLASDSSRLANQLNALKNLVQEQGWQILYFSVKEEVLRHLEKKIPSGILHMENGFIKE